VALLASKSGENRRPLSACSRSARTSEVPSLYLPLFQQTVQGATATSSGLLLLPMMIPLVVAANIAGKVMSRTGRYKVFPVVGTALLTAGWLLLATTDADTSRTLTGCYMALVGLGLGLSAQMGTTIAQNSVELRDMGAASASTNLFRTLGGSLGVALFGLPVHAGRGHAGAGRGPGLPRRGGRRHPAHLLPGGRRVRGGLPGSGVRQGGPAARKTGGSRPAGAAS
jgi:hypothetical protein